jgi:hypothetical protein
VLKTKRRKARRTNIITESLMPNGFKGNYVYVKLFATSLTANIQK